jgi:hypothetical protein
MQIPVRHTDWQILRAVARGKSRPVVGKKLRVVQSRDTKDGSFLTRLVDTGLLEVVTTADDPFEATYRLTPMGVEGAEYGLCEVDFEVFKKRAAAKKKKDG